MPYHCEGKRAIIRLANVTQERALLSKQINSRGVQHTTGTTDTGSQTHGRNTLFSQLYRVLWLSVKERGKMA